ncbi:MAG: response regulator [Ferruginibacter sp.]
MSKPLKILLIEDDVDDIELLELALNGNNVKYTLDVVMEGDLVYPYMNKSEKLPEIIILDFNLPKVHGRDVLKQIKSSEKFCKIPLVVLTTSSSKDDVEFAYLLGASKFITKPTTLEDFNSAITAIVECYNEYNSVKVNVRR